MVGPVYGREAQGIVQRTTDGKNTTVTGLWAVPKWAHVKSRSLVGSGDPQKLTYFANTT